MTTARAPSWHDAYPSEPDTAAEPVARKPRVYREHLLQQKVKTFARDAIDLPADDYQFYSFDSAKAGDRARVRDAARGVAKSTLDTLLEVRGMPGIWYELKAKGKAPGDDQFRMMEKLVHMGRCASWGTNVISYMGFLHACGVPLKQNATYQAMVLDGKVESLIARKSGAAPKAARKAKAPPRYTLGKLATAKHRRAGRV